MHIAEEAVEVVAMVVAEGAEEIILTNHGQDRYRTRRTDLFKGDYSDL